MKNINLLSILLLVSCSCVPTPNQEREDNDVVQKQQRQYAVSQPLPLFDHSLERQTLINLYKLRNETISTFTIWRSDTGKIEGYCPSSGFGIPYDMSLTNPLQLIGNRYVNGVVGQAEPNGVFSSQNTSATWVMCLDEKGKIRPHYIESKVTVYPCSHVDMSETFDGPVVCSGNARFVNLG